MPYKDPEDQKRAARKHYEANREAYLARTAAYNKQVREEIRAHIRALKSCTPCTDCGISYHYAAMEFDHVRGDKKFNIATTKFWTSMSAVLAEIEKCELVCANCHRMRTVGRM